jgi:cell division protein FtsW (lipid II flippase)
MIQRIQSIWFFLAALCIALLLFVPIISKVINDSEYWINTIGLYQQTNGAANKIEAFLPMTIITVASAILLLVTIFMFKDRKRQKSVAFVSLILILVLSILTYINLEKITGGLEGVTYKLGAILPIIAIIFIYLGVRGINNDEKLIKSADRLR